MNTTNIHFENIQNGWNISEAIDFGFFNEAYTSGRANLNDLTAMVASDCGIRDDDNSTWANDMRDIICYALIAFDRALTDDYNGDYEALNGVICADYLAPALTDEREAATTAWDIRDAMKFDNITGEGYYSAYEKAVLMHEACA